MELTTRYEVDISSLNYNIHPFPGLTSFTKGLLNSEKHRKQRPLFTRLTLTYSKLAHLVQKTRHEIYVFLKFSLEEKWEMMKEKK